jgi:hypothetical protein
MQGIAVAITPNAISTVIGQLLGSQIATGLQQNMTEPPNDTINDIAPWTETGQATSETWSNYVLNLTNGEFTSFAPVYQSCAQQAPDPPASDTGQFEVTVDAPNCSVTYDWVESYTQTVFPAPPFENGSKNVGPNKPPYSYEQSFTSFNVSVTYALAYSAKDGNYAFTYLACSTSPEGEQATIPSQSVLNDQVSGECFSSNVSSATENQLENLNYSGTVTGIVNDIMATIPASGELEGGAVTFDFGPSSSTALQFPDNNGVTAGVLGDVSAGGTSYSTVVTPPSDVPVPQLPSGGDAPWWDVAYNIQDYQLNALFWGYYQAGMLDTTLTEADFNNGVGGPSNPLYTSYYANAGPLKVIYTTYPDQPMQALLTATGPPTVTFQGVYALTPTNVATISMQLSDQGVLTPAMSTALTAMGSYGFVYIGLDAFNDFVTTQCAALQPYLASIVDPNAETSGIVLSVEVECALSIPDVSGAPTILVWEAAENFILQDVTLGPLDGTVQSLSSTLVGSTDQTLTLTPISTTLGTGVSGSLGAVWAFLETPWQEVLQYVATQGVPVPCLEGLEVTPPAPPSSGPPLSPVPVTINLPTSDTDGYVAVFATIQAT